MRAFFLFILSFACLIAMPALALDVKDVRFGKHPDKVRSVIELSTDTNFKVFALQNPYRLVIDLPTFNWQANNAGNLGKFGLKALRTGQLDTSTSRIVYELNSPFTIENAFILPPNTKSKERLVVDFKKSTTSAFNAQQGTVFQNDIIVSSSAAADHTPILTSAVPPEEPHLETPQQTATIIPAQKPPPPVKAPTQKAPAQKPLIIIDPGHGGNDPGAVGHGNKREKDVVFALSKELKRQLEATGRYRVKLTRNNDRYIRLRDRVKIARDKEADLFLSIHADSINKPSVSGASVYTLSERASDAQTARLAARENRSDIIAGVDLGVEDREVANILVDLARRDTMNQSKFFAEKLVKNFKAQNIRTLTNPHRHAGFAVLKAPDIPSVLVEAGFMSNRKEAEKLSGSAYRKRIARALTTGIETYFAKVRENAQ